MGNESPKNTNKESSIAKDVITYATGIIRFITELRFTVLYIMKSGKMSRLVAVLGVCPWGFWDTCHYAVQIFKARRLFGVGSCPYYWEVFYKADAEREDCSHITCFDRSC